MKRKTLSSFHFQEEDLPANSTKSNEYPHALSEHGKFVSQEKSTRRISSSTLKFMTQCSELQPSSSACVTGTGTKPFSFVNKLDIRLALHNGLTSFI